MPLWLDIVNLLMPATCRMCGKRLGGEERYICTSCVRHLPHTGYHLVEHNPLEKQFWGHFPIERAAAMFHHDGERTRHLMYHIKYWGHPQLATRLAALYAEELKESHFFEGIDTIIPLPLHWRRQMKRHYNQSHYIAQGIRQATGLPIDKNVVKRVKYNPSQTHLSPRERIQNVEGIFRVTHPERIQGKHLLLIDDVTTTGSTLASCAKELAQVEGVRISILTLAVASRTPAPASEKGSVEASVYGLPLME